MTHSSWRRASLSRTSGGKFGGRRWMPVDNPIRRLTTGASSPTMRRTLDQTAGGGYVAPRPARPTTVRESRRGLRNPPGDLKARRGPLRQADGSLQRERPDLRDNAVCPHRGGPLAAGTLTGSVVGCPWHGWTFDVTTGQPDHPGGHSVAAYDVKVEGGVVYVGWLTR